MEKEVQEEIAPLPKRLPQTLAAVFPLGTALPEEAKERFETGRFIVIQDVLSPVSPQDAANALEPAKPFAPPLFVRPSIGGDSWMRAVDCEGTSIRSWTSLGCSSFAIPWKGPLTVPCWDA